MPAVQQNWRHQGQEPTTRSILGREAPRGPRLNMVGGYPDRYQPGAGLGEKRHLGNDGRSMASKFSRTSVGSKATLKHYGRHGQTTSNVPEIPPEDYYKPGTIIIADHVEEAYDQASVLGNDRSIIRIAGQRDLCKKSRPFIILAAHSQSYLSVPIFSHQGNGTARKPRPEEYISVHDHRATVQPPVQSKHKPLITRNMAGSELMPSSVAHIAYPVSWRYVTPVTIIGRLTITSTNQLIQIFRKYMPVEVSEAKQKSSNGVRIHAGMTVSEAVTDLRLHKYALIFRNVSWSSAGQLSQSDLKSKGITDPAVCARLCALFDEVEIASNSGPNWAVTVN